ncbi:MAG TPA: phosphatase PAP2 family protein [Labilithrix sp.]|jgi:membrane-associated phospholipid phosphatase|nr:phosphatase PAP2 family protein [Labilithrix sp.]
MSLHRRVRAVVCAVVLLSVALPAPAMAEQEKTVQWNENWPRVRWIEILNVIALTIGSGLVHATPVADRARWEGPILFDGPARRLMKLDTARRQRVAANISDYLYKGMVLAPYIVDNYITALGVHQNADVALQMTLIDMQSLGLSGVITLGVEHATGRARPYTRDCTPGVPGPDKIGFNYCGGPDDFQSFYSGHAAAAFTMAGLTCAHHQHLPLYGGGMPDVMACVVMLGLASTTGVMRIMADRHWASDVIVGSAVGVINGYVVPLWLHYGFGNRAKALPTAVNTAWGLFVPVPQVYEGGGGIGLTVF